MGGKKPPAKSSAKSSAKAKAKAAAAPEEEEQESPEKLEAKRLWQQRREASKWVKAMLDTVRGQLEAAKGRGSCDWLQVAHEFHEIRLIKACKHLEEKTLDEMPQELREGLEAYVAQCAGGTVPQQEAFREERQLWELLPAEATDGGSYTRPQESPGAEEASAQVRAWVDASEQGMTGLSKLMREWEASAGVAEAGLTRLGGLFSEAREEGAASGLTAALVMPMIEAALHKHIADAPVQRAGCAALRGLSMAEGQLPALCDGGGVQLAVEAVRVHLKVADVVSAANGAFWAMAKAAGKNSPELSIMRNAGVVEVLKKAMDYHAWDQTLCGRVRVTLPFITED